MRGDIPRPGVTSGSVQAEPRKAMSRRIAHAATAVSFALTLVFGVAPTGASGPGQQPPLNLTPPSISGTAQVGSSLNASPGVWSGKGVKYGYGWVRCDVNGASCSAIDGATATTYSPAPADVGATLRVVVTATNRNGSAVATSDATSAVVGAPAAPPPSPSTPPSATAPPTISGTAQQGQTVSASTGTWSGTTPMTYAYQWQRCDSAGAACSPIAGATAAAYLLASADVGSTVRVSVTASDSVGSATATSAATAQVTGAATLAPSYWSWAGNNLTLGNATTNHWANATNNGAPEGTTIDSKYISLVPNGSGGQATRLTITPFGTPNPSGGVMTALENPATYQSKLASGLPYSQLGQSTWYRFDVRFPSGLFVPVSGNWNILSGWHTEYYGVNGISTYGPLNSDLIVKSDGFGGVGTNPRLAFLLRGGQVSGPYSGAGTIQYDITVDNLTGPLVYDRWYSVLVHFVWYPDSRGSVEIFVDGVQKYSNPSFPTMATWQDGTVWPDGIGIYNYRSAAITNQSSVDFQNVNLGPTLASVGG
jgi:hypothetical protein